MLIKSIVIMMALICLNVSQSAIAQSHNTSGTGNRAVVLVDRNCIDGEFIIEQKEQFLQPSDFPSIQDLIDNYSDKMTFINGILERRFPTGKAIVDLGGESALDMWLMGANSASGILRSLGMALHEVGHGITEQVPENDYLVYADKQTGDGVHFIVPGMHGKNNWSGSPMHSMARSGIVNDEYHNLGPAGCDTYISTYLTGSSGQQGYNSLIDELNQYVNSLAYAYYFQDVVNVRPSSDVHALLTWLWWNERYLRKIRTDHPDQYEYLFTNDTWLEVILTQWGRAWMYLYTGFPGMEPATTELHKLVRDQDLLSEIQLIRDSCDCDNPEEYDPNTMIQGKKDPVIPAHQVTNFNYPNPFKANMSIVLEIQNEQEVQIDLFNSRGLKIHTLFNGGLDKGVHTFKWDSSGYADGVYLYKIAVGGTQYKGKAVKHTK
jgi:hypothetical protein